MKFLPFPQDDTNAKTAFQTLDAMFSSAILSGIVQVQSKCNDIFSNCEFEGASVQLFRTQNLHAIEFEFTDQKWLSLSLSSVVEKALIEFE